ncbi:MAG TPA: phosphatidylserine decarboxylase [Chthoniobacteraceae bacterium]|jgi:phosphatidylserine decarboxylase|nr:phosphatidylserine decarboxylase [Chthoniobacteraceae bacterium]
MRFQTLYEGRWIFLIVAAIGWLGWFLGWFWLVVLAALLVIFCLNFFRDPDREVPPGDDVVVAAADGVVADIVEIEESEVLMTRCKRVGIFLNVFDVHVNKAPIAGRISYFQHHPGLFLDARNPECSIKNEALTWAIEGKSATLVIRQITGAIARRIVPWSKLGDQVEKGFRFGMIRFGSRTEIYLPMTAIIEVKLGDKVRGAETIIAKLI